MPRGVQSEMHDIYVRPVPTVVAQIWDEKSPAAAACERWFWVPYATLAKIATEGRQIVARRAGARRRTSSARSTTPEQDARVIESVRRLGSVWHAAAEHGIKLGVVHRILRENDVAAPKPNRTEVAMKAAETKRRRAAA